MLKTISWLFLLISLVAFTVTGYQLWLRYNPVSLSFSTPPVPGGQTEQKKLSGVTLSIPAVNINNLPVFTENIDNNQWPLTSKGLIHLGSSPIPGGVGNSIIYGHDWKNIFGSLVYVKPGETVEVSYPDGSKKEFEIKFTQVVSPNQTQILDQTKDKRITLYTCTGFLDSERFVATAFLMK